MVEIGVVIYTHDRVEDAKKNMEIIRKLWQPTGHFGDIKIVHAFNGEKEWYPQQTNEDILIHQENSTHFKGASDLIDAGTATLLYCYPNLDYHVILAADTWLVKPGYLADITEQMKERNLRLATCSWGLPERNDIFDVGMATDFFAADAKWAKRSGFFPFNYSGFEKELLEIYGKLPKKYLLRGHVMLERLAIERFKRAVANETGEKNTEQKALEKIFRMSEREPVHTNPKLWDRKFFYPKIGLLTQHDFNEKLQYLQSLHLPDIS